MKLGLGTVQFGLEYGISNTSGKTSLKEVDKILKTALENGIDVLDTAYSYGDSESVIGRCLSEHNDFRVITKTPYFKKQKFSAEDGGIIKKTFYESLKRLKLSSVTGLVIHHTDDALKDGGGFLYERMLELKYKGLVEKIGFSVYTKKQIDKILDLYDFDLIQLPVNALDQRLIKSGELEKLKNKGIEIHARSIFLQGLLLMDPDTIHPFFNEIKPILQKYRKFLDLEGLTTVEGAFGFVKEIPEIDYIVVGVNNLKQLKDNMQSFNRTSNNLSIDSFKEFYIDDPKFINPGSWELN